MIETREPIPAKHTNWHQCARCGVWGRSDTGRMYMLNGEWFCSAQLVSRLGVVFMEPCREVPKNG